MLSDKPVVFSAKRISKDFGAGKTLKTAVKDVSFDIYDEEFISIVGGSGCGKSVLAKIMLGLYKPTRGQFLYRDKPIKNLKEHWNEVQSVFQDPFGCFNQFFTIRSQLEDSLNILKNKPSKDEIRRRVDEGLMAVNVIGPYLRAPPEGPDCRRSYLHGGRLRARQHPRLPPQVERRAEDDRGVRDPRYRPC